MHMHGSFLHKPTTLWGGLVLILIFIPLLWFGYSHALGSGSAQSELNEIRDLLSEDPQTLAATHASESNARFIVIGTMTNSLVPGLGLPDFDNLKPPGVKHYTHFTEHPRDIQDAFRSWASNYNLELRTIYPPNH